MGDHNIQKNMTFNETCVIVSIAYLIIYENSPFSLSQTPRFNNMLDLEKAFCLEVDILLAHFFQIKHIIEPRFLR